MGKIQDFLTREFLPRRDDLVEPDGRLLHLYKCEDREFWRLVKLLREFDAPSGHAFEQYRKQWMEFREELQSGGRQDGFTTFETKDLNWTVRGFVLYASEFWRRFRDEEWRRRSFPDALPFRKLTWLQFLSLVGWTKLYHGKKIAGSVKLEGTSYHVAHTSVAHASEFRADGSEWDNAEDDAGGSDHRSMTGTGHYPGLYFPMLAAWDWWKVAPVRLPSSIRYLDTFAHQGAAGDMLVVECQVAFRSGSKVYYEPVKPPNGYGIGVLSIEEKALPADANSSELNVTLLFGSHGELGEE